MDVRATAGPEFRRMPRTVVIWGSLVGLDGNTRNSFIISTYSVQDSGVVAVGGSCHQDLGTGSGRDQELP